MGVNIKNIGEENNNNMLGGNEKLHDTEWHGAQTPGQ